MFNRLLMRSISSSRLPLTIKPNIIISPFIKRCENLEAHIKNHDLLLKKYFTTEVPIKHEDSETPASTSLSQNETDTKTEDTIPEELKIQIENDPSLLQKYQILRLEVDVMKHTGKSVPNNIKPSQWLELFKQDTRASRRRYLQFLFLTEKKRENGKKKKEASKIQRSKSWETDVVQDSEYRLHKNTLFMRFYDTTMNQFYHSRLIQAMLYGEKIVIDCGHYNQMTARECSECAKQLAYMFAQNRIHKDPFDIHFCNVNKSSILMQKLNRMIPTVYQPEFPLNIHENSYTEVFEKDKLIYLTPHCNMEMTEYDPDSVYIIGAIVDKSNSQPLSLAKAKKEGIRMAKLPLDKYLLWKSGSGKRLPLNQMLNIMTDIRVTGDWHEALKHIPRRKLEKGLNHYQSDSYRKESIERYNYNNRPTSNKPYQQKTPSSFSYKERQRKSYVK